MVTAEGIADELVLRGAIAEEGRPLALSCAKQAMEWVTNYIHAPDVPEGLFYTCVELASSLLCGVQASSGAGSGVASISEGDTTISFREASGGAALSAAAARHYAQLGRYRKGLFQ